MVPAAARQRAFEVAMSLKMISTIEIPGSAGSSFDHGAFDPKSRRVFVAHTGRDCVEVIDHDARKHIATLAGFPQVAGVVAEDGTVLVTNRGAASLACVNAFTLKRRPFSKPVLDRMAWPWCHSGVWRSPPALEMKARAPSSRCSVLTEANIIRSAFPGH